MRVLSGVALLLIAASHANDALARNLAEQRDGFDPAAMLDQHCVRCHNDEDWAGGWSLGGVDVMRPLAHHETWEKVLAKLQRKMMPPPDAERPRPDDATYAAMIAYLESTIDAALADSPQPGRTATLRRLNRTEYQNAIRDLLALEVDASTLLPHDESGHGFDNVNLSDFSPSLLDRYVGAAQKIARLAVGTSDGDVDVSIVRVEPDVTQEAHVPGLPIGTRGGVLVEHHFPQDGLYDIRVRLARDRNEEVEGLKEPHQLEVLLDKAPIASFTIEPPPDPRDHSKVDGHLELRAEVSAGRHHLGVTFPQIQASLLETARQPLVSRYNLHRHPRLNPAIYQVSITGPYEPRGAGMTEARKRLFVTTPASERDEERAATEILQGLMRRAYRRPVTNEDVTGPLEFFREGRRDGGFEAGIERALAAVLVSPEFLFRVEADEPNAARGDVYGIDDLTLASRLSFFLWSSIPDDELLTLAERGELSEPNVLEGQVRRMLRDERAYNLAGNFAGQWLHLKKLEGWRPDARLFPDVDDNLREAFRLETELLVDSVIREDGSVFGSPGRRLHVSERTAGEALRHSPCVRHTDASRRSVR